MKLLYLRVNQVVIFIHHVIIIILKYCVYTSFLFSLESLYLYENPRGL